MPEPTAEDIAKKLTLTLDGWHKKNEKHIKLLDNLVLDCELCTTKEVKAIVQKEIDLSLKILKPEFDRLNKQNKDLFKAVPKAERKDMLKEIKDIVDKRTTIFNKDGVKVNVSGELDDGVPYFKLEGSF